MKQAENKTSNQEKLSTVIYKNHFKWKFKFRTFSVTITKIKSKKLQKIFMEICNQ